MNFSCEHCINEFDKTGVDNLYNLVRIGGIEFVRSLESKGFVILYPYATYDDFGDEIDGVYQDGYMMCRTIKNNHTAPSKGKTQSNYH